MRARCAAHFLTPMIPMHDWLLFAAADVFLFTSLEDNLPIMVQEALAAATPVVGFAAGGVPEMVDHGKTGWLCPVGDQGALNQILRDALERDDLSVFGEAAQETVRERFDMDIYEAVGMSEFSYYLSQSSFFF